MIVSTLSSTAVPSEIAGEKAVLKRTRPAAPIIAYCCMLLVLAGLTMAQTNMLPATPSAAENRLSQAVTGHEVVAYLQAIHGQDVANDQRYAAIIQRMTALGDQPVNSLDWKAITPEASKETSAE